MTVTPIWIDVGPHLAAGQQPVFMLPRPPLHDPEVRATLVGPAQDAWAGEFWVARGSLADNPSWTVVRHGEFVMVPVHAYRTAGRGLAALFACGLQLGAQAALTFLEHARQRPQELVLVLGHDCSDLAAEDALRGYVGVAFRTA
jgi:hypothetical protein